MISFERNAAHPKQPLDHLRGELDGGAPLLVAQCCDHIVALADGNIIATEGAQLVWDDLEPKVNAYDAAHLGRRALNEAELIFGVDINPHTELRRAFDLLISLVTTVYDNLICIGATHEGCVELSVAEAVSARALLEQDRTYGEVVIGLDRVEDVDGRWPDVGKSLPDAPEVSPQRRLRDDVKRRAGIP